ncbi:MAG: hypothetical protein GY833_16395 [Aestuariibacter sp.]|nr:hypothetical protein [Aestuariibacter sp.]
MTGEVQDTGNLEEPESDVTQDGGSVDEEGTPEPTEAEEQTGEEGNEEGDPAEEETEVTAEDLRRQLQSAKDKAYADRDAAYAEKEELRKEIDAIRKQLSGDNGNGQPQADPSLTPDEQRVQALNAAMMKDPRNKAYAQRLNARIESGDLDRADASDMWQNKMDAFEAIQMARGAQTEFQVAKLSSTTKNILSQQNTTDTEQIAISKELNNLGVDLEKPETYVGLRDGQLESLIQMATNSVRYAQAPPPPKPKQKPKPPKVMGSSGQTATPTGKQKFNSFRDLANSMKD